MTTFLKEASVNVGGQPFKATFTNGEETTDLRCAQFFMKMQDEGHDVEAARSYADIGPMIAPDPSINWDEINRVLATF